MKKWLAIFLMTAAMTVPSPAQNGQAQVGNFNVLYVSLAPSGVCSPNSYIEVVTTNGIIYTCQGGVWGAIGGSEGGELTSFEAGNLTPLFTTSVASPDSAPVLTFTLSAAGAHSFLGNNTGSSATPAYVQPAFTDLSGSIDPTQLPSTTFTWPGGSALIINPVSGTVSANDFVGGTFTGDCSGCTGLQAGQLAGTIPLANGGTGSATAPSAGQILVAQSSSSYAPKTISGACAISTDGVLTCSPTFSSLSGGVNTSAPMVVGSGASLSATGTGTIVATSIPASGLTGTTLASNVVESSLTVVGTITTGVWNGTAISNANLANSSITVNGQSCVLGSTCTVASDASTLTGTTLASNVVVSSLTSVGTITTGVWNGTAIANANLANSATTVNGQTCTLGSTCTTTAAASTLTGATLASNVVTSSLTSVGTLTNLSVTNAPVFNALTGYLYGNASGAVTASTTIPFSAITGAPSGTVTSFVASSGSWPAWLVPTVSNATTTPTLSVAASAIPFASLASLSANTVLGALTATTPSGLAVPSCSTASSALTWTSGTGFGCNTITPGTGTVTSIATTGPITGGTITTTGTIGCATCVIASSPGVGIAHFAGSTQTVTSSLVNLATDVTGVLPAANGGSADNTSSVTIVPGAGAGTGGTADCVGGTTCTSARGRVTITSGTLPSAGTVAVATFGTAYATTPVCAVTMNGGAAFLIPGWSSTTGVLTITTGIAIGVSTTVELDYFCQL